MNGAAALCWPASRVAEGLEVLARAARLPIRVRDIARAGAGDYPADGDEPFRVAAASLGLEVEPVESSYGEVATLLRSAGPAIVKVGDDAFVMLVAPRGRGRRVTVVRPDHRLAAVPADLLVGAIVGPQEAPLAAETRRLVDETGIAERRRAALVRALVAERLRGRRLRGCWLLKVPTGRDFRAQLAAAGARRRFLLLLAAHAGEYLLWIGSWWILGRAALQGHLDAAWLGAWALALFTLIPVHLAALWLQGRLSITAGALLKRRLLAGVFRLEPEEIRTEGAGQLLGRVIEAQAVESLALGGGFMALLAGVELVIAAVVLAMAAPLVTILLLAWSALAAALAAVYFRRRFDWVGLRVALTHDLIERMVGHRTRLAQQRRDRWHDGEDDALERYVRASGTMDRAAVWLLAFVPRGWMLVGVCGLAPLFVAGRSPVSLAVGLGGVLLAFRAYKRLTAGVWNLAGAAIAWRQTAPVFKAAARETLDDVVHADPRRAGTDGGRPVLDGTDLSFTHAGRGEPVLRACTVGIAPGDRVILQGASGSGKSTLASLLAGLRTPQSGLLLLDGLDRHTLGLDGWRRRVVLVPQFHENHIVLGSVAFNLLMGVEWPPSAEDFARAEAICRELGLGEVLDKMPAGVLQTIGETGWQLSHGERSRLFLARALLQRRDVLILDESFAQLDAQSLQRALDAVLARTPTVLLIAHP